MFLRKPFRKRNFIVLIFTVSLLIFTFNFFQTQVRNYIYLFSAPLQRVMWQEGEKISSFLKIFKEKRKMEETVTENS